MSVAVFGRFARRALVASAVLTCGASLAAAPPPAGGTIAIQPRTADGEYDAAMPAFVDAAGRILTARGFTILDDPAHAAAVAELTLSRVDVGTALTKDPHAAKVGIGPGVVVPFSTGNSNEAPLRRTSLELRIRLRSGAVVWDGTAVTVRAAGTPSGTPGTVAALLTGALLHAYPVQPRGVIGVP